MTSPHAPLPTSLFCQSIARASDRDLVEKKQASQAFRVEFSFFDFFTFGLSPSKTLPIRTFGIFLTAVTTITTRSNRTCRSGEALTARLNLYLTGDSHETRFVCHDGHPA